MVPWKILKFEVAKDVISCTLGAKQDEIKSCCCAASVERKQQHKQDLRKIYREGRRILELITFYQNALHLTRLHCATFNQSALRPISYLESSFLSAHAGFTELHLNLVPRVSHLPVDERPWERG